MTGGGGDAWWVGSALPFEHSSDAHCFGVYSVLMGAKAIENLALDGLLPPLKALPVIGEQGDIRYGGNRAKTVLNTPESTGMGYWSLNPYVGCAFGCAYCYARYAHRYAMERASSNHSPAELLDNANQIPPWLAFERRIVVKENAAQVLRNTLRHGSEKHLGLVRGESLVIGTATDPYQPAERKFRITRDVLQVLADHPGMHISIITKSPLVTRDIDLLTRIARHSRIVVHLSLITPHRELARRLEPRSPTPDSRLRALSRLRDAGVDAGLFCMPVLPGITDGPADLELLIRSVAERGATHFVAGTLRLRSTARDRYLPVIAQEFPELLDRYKRSYSRNHELGKRYRRGLSKFVSALCKQYGVPCGHPREEPAAQMDEVEQLELI